MSDFYPLYDYQLETCPPIPIPSLGGDDKDSKSTADSSTNQALTQAFRTRDRPAIKEYILAVWIFTLFCEEIRQVSLIRLHITLRISFSLRSS